MHINSISNYNFNSLSNNHSSKISFGIGGRYVYDDDCELNWSNGWGPVPYYKKTSFDSPFGYEYDDDCKINWSNGWGPKPSKEDKVTVSREYLEKLQRNAERAERCSFNTGYPQRDVIVCRPLKRMKVKSCMD